MLSRIFELASAIALLLTRYEQEPNQGAPSAGLQSSVAGDAGRREDDEAVGGQLDPLEPELEVVSRGEHRFERDRAVERDRRAVGAEARGDQQRSAPQEDPALLLAAADV